MDEDVGIRVNSMLTESERLVSWPVLKMSGSGPENKHSGTSIAAEYPGIPWPRPEPTSPCNGAPAELLPPPIISAKPRV